VDAAELVRATYATGMLDAGAGTNPVGLAIPLDIANQLL